MCTPAEWKGARDPPLRVSSRSAESHLEPLSRSVSVCLGLSVSVSVRPSLCLCLSLSLSLSLSVSLSLPTPLSCTAMKTVSVSLSLVSLSLYFSVSLSLCLCLLPSLKLARGMSCAWLRSSGQTKRMEVFTCQGPFLCNFPVSLLSTLWL